MKKYLGIYNNSTTCTIESYNIDDNNLYEENFELSNSIEELEKKETDAICLHIYELDKEMYEYSEHCAQIYKYITTKGIK